MLAEIVVMGSLMMMCRSVMDSPLGGVAPCSHRRVA